MIEKVTKFEAQMSQNISQSLPREIQSTQSLKNYIIEQVNALNMNKDEGMSTQQSNQMFTKIEREI